MNRWTTAGVGLLGLLAGASDIPVAPGAPSAASAAPVTAGAAAVVAGRRFLHVSLNSLGLPARLELRGV